LASETDGAHAAVSVAGGHASRQAASQSIQVLWKRKESCQKFGKVNFFKIPKSSDIGRSLESVLGKFQKCDP